MELAIALGLVGLLLGAYCHFLILVPLTLAAGIGSAIFAAWHGQTLLETLTTILAMAATLQGAYMVGLTGREFLVRSRRV
jgi:hypothetical protein